MMPRWRPETPHGGDLSGHDEYAIWDAAYVLGSLSSVERREFEAHMADCPLCRSAVGELIGMPVLLSQLDRDEIAAIDNRSRVEPLLPAELLPSLLAKVSWRRRRSRIVTWTAEAVAAAVLAIGVLVGVGGHYPTSVPTPPQASVSVQPMAQVGTNRHGNASWQMSRFACDWLLRGAKRDGRGRVFGRTGRCTKNRNAEMNYNINSNIYSIPDALPNNNV